jgi:hypothetical protein
MKLSPATIAILKNFASINSNIYIAAGNVVKVRSVQKNSFAQATIEETFESPVCLYDLNEFLSVIAIGADGDITIKDNHLVIKWGKSKLTYNFADPVIMRMAIEASEKVITMPECEVEFELTSDMLAAIQKASSILKSQFLSIYSNEGTIAIKTYDKEDPNSNAYQIDTDVATPYTFNMLLKIEDLKLLGGSYDVSINRNNISRWVKQGSGVVYYIAMDTFSTFE